MTRIAARGALAELALGAVALGVGGLAGVHPLAGFRWSSSGIAAGLVATVPLLLGFAVVSAAPIAPLARLREEMEKIVALIFADATIVDLALLSLAAGIGEEILFRGLVQQWLQTAMGPAIGLGLASALFGLAHPISRTYVVVATLVGAYLGWLWQLTGNLIAPITAHAAYDFVVLWMLTRRA